MDRRSFLKVTGGAAAMTVVPGASAVASGLAGPVPEPNTVNFTVSGLKAGSRALIAAASGNPVLEKDILYQGLIDEGGEVRIPVDDIAECESVMVRARHPECQNIHVDVVHVSGELGSNLELYQIPDLWLE